MYYGLVVPTQPLQQLRSKSRCVWTITGRYNPLSDTSRLLERFQVSAFEPTLAHSSPGEEKECGAMI